MKSIRCCPFGESILCVVKPDGRSFGLCLRLFLYATQTPRRLLPRSIWENEILEVDHQSAANENRFELHRISFNQGSNVSSPARVLGTFPKHCCMVSHLPHRYGLSQRTTVNQRTMGWLIRRVERLAESHRASVPGSEAEERERGRITNNPAILGSRVESGQRS